MASAIRAMKRLKEQVSLVEDLPDGYYVWLYVGHPQEGSPGHINLGDLRKLVQWFEKE